MPKWKRINKLILKTFPVIILLIFIQGCYSYTHPDGKKEKSLRFSGDRFKKHDEFEELQLKPFELGNFYKVIDTTFVETCYVEEINRENILSLANQSGSIFVLFWFPNCGSIYFPISDLLLEIEKEKTIPVALVSLTYDLGNIIVWQFTMGYTTQSYVLDRSYGKTILEKHYNIILDLCPDCFQKFGMDYTKIYGLVLTDEGLVKGEMLLEWDEISRSNQIRDKNKLVSLILRDPED